MEVYVCEPIKFRDCRAWESYQGMEKQMDKKPENVTGAIQFCLVELKPAESEILFPIQSLEHYRKTYHPLTLNLKPFPAAGFAEKSLMLVSQHGKTSLVPFSPPLKQSLLVRFSRVCNTTWPLGPLLRVILRYLQ